MKCANCDRDALFVYQITADKEIPYCGKDLPGFLDARRRAGNLKTTDEFLAERKGALTALAEAPKPKKRSKKATENNEGNS